MRIALIEDTLTCAEQLQTLLDRFSLENNTEIRCEYFSSGTAFLQRSCLDWDLVLLDIELPGINGVDVARKIRAAKSDVLIIFITQMAQYAIEGYSVQAFDYILKPVNYYAFSMKLQQVQNLLKSRESQYLVISTQNSKIRLNLNELRYVEVFNHTLTYHTISDIFSSTSFSSLGKLEKELHSSHFARCHSGYLVNLSFVTGYEKNEVSLDKDTSLPLSRTYNKPFLEKLSAYWRHAAI